MSYRRATSRSNNRIRHVKYAYESGYLIALSEHHGRYQVMIINPNKPDLPRVILATEGKLEGIDASPNGEWVLTTVKLKNDNLESRVWSMLTGSQQGKPILHEEAVERWEFIPSIDRVSGVGAASPPAGRVDVF